MRTLRKSNKSVLAFENVTRPHSLWLLLSSFESNYLVLEESINPIPYAKYGMTIEERKPYKCPHCCAHASSRSSNVNHCQGTTGLQIKT